MPFIAHQCWSAGIFYMYKSLIIIGSNGTLYSPRTVFFFIFILKLKNIYSVFDWGFSVLMFMSDTCSYSLNQLSWDVGTGAVLSFHAGVTHGILPYKRSCRLESSCVQSNSCHSRHVTEETDESIFKFQTHTAHIIWLDPFITQNLIWVDMP
jgi:hypothetical protein